MNLVVRSKMRFYLQAKAAVTESKLGVFSIVFVSWSVMLSYSPYTSFAKKKKTCHVSVHF